MANEGVRGWGFGFWIYLDQRVSCTAEGAAGCPCSTYPPSLEEHVRALDVARHTSHVTRHTSHITPTLHKRVNVVNVTAARQRLQYALQPFNPRHILPTNYSLREQIPTHTPNDTRKGLNMRRTSSAAAELFDAHMTFTCTRCGFATMCTHRTYFKCEGSIVLQTGRGGGVGRAVTCSTNWALRWRKAVAAAAMRAMAAPPMCVMAMLRLLGAGHAK